MPLGAFGGVCACNEPSLSPARRKHTTTNRKCFMSATDDTNLCSSREFELIQSILVLVFTPTIHRTYREVRAWFRELEPEDIAQQVLTFFLELAASAPSKR